MQSHSYKTNTSNTQASQRIEGNIADGTRSSLKPLRMLPPSPDLRESFSLNPERTDIPFLPPTQQIQNSPEEFEGSQQGLPLKIVLRKTGLGIKLRFLIALTLVAVFPAFVLVLLLGDPSGQEQRNALGQTLFLQAQSQASALNQTIAARQLAVSSLAKTPALIRATQGGDTGTSHLALTAAQQVDQTSIDWLLIQPKGKIIASADSTGKLEGMQLSQTKIVADSQQLTQFVQAVSLGDSKGTLLLSDDSHVHGGWAAIASRLPQGQGEVLLAVFSLEKLTHGLLTVSSPLAGEASALLDQHARLIADAGLGTQKIFVAVPPIFQSLQTKAPSSIVVNNSLTNRKDIVGAADVPALDGRYLLFAPQDTALAPSPRIFFAGRNTPLLILGILVIVVLVATWVALPIVRPIRRATRAIERTTGGVRVLADDARRIAHEHEIGTTILSGASKRLGSRRQSIIRDGTTIAQLCQASQPRMRWLYQIARGNQAAVESLQVIQQAFSQIYQLGSSIASSLENDATLNQLDGAMESAREISNQFEGAGQQLEYGAEQLETAARSLL